MKKKSSKQKRKFHPLYQPMYGINNWCGIRAAAIEELEEQESSKKSKAKTKYVSLENAVMSRIINRRKVKMQQKINISLITMNKYCILKKNRKIRKRTFL